jgi:hypothetical protein
MEWKRYIKAELASPSTLDDDDPIVEGPHPHYIGELRRGVQ